jgi:hypothetical protein
MESGFPPMFAPISTVGRTGVKRSGLNTLVSSGFDKILAQQGNQHREPARTFIPIPRACLHLMLCGKVGQHEVIRELILAQVV